VLQLESPRSRPYALYTLGQVHQRQGRDAYAVTSFEEGIRVAQRNVDPFIEAYLQRSLGLLHRQNDRSPAAEVALRAALELFRRMNIAHEIAPTEEALTSLAVSAPVEPPFSGALELR
jgi:hypothetical protein